MVTATKDDNGKIFQDGKHQIYMGIPSFYIECWSIWWVGFFEAVPKKLRKSKHILPTHYW